MSGSRLGRGRGGRLAVYGACGVVVVLLVFLYRAATTEMSRLRELHVQCAHQQEALAAQLQVIFEYKVRLEKSLAEEKSSNAAVKQELQQRASDEKSLRDKNTIEAMQRYNSLQQDHKLLQSEHQDLEEKCDKQQKQVSEDKKRLEGTLSDLKGQLREAAEDKKKTLEHLKNKNLELENNKTIIEEKYNELRKSNGNSDSKIMHLQKEVEQLERELKESQNSCKATSPGPSMISPRSAHQLAQPNVENNQPIQGVSADEQQGNRPSAGNQQVSRPSNEGDANPHPIQAPRDHQPIRNLVEDNKNDEDIGGGGGGGGGAAAEKESISHVGFIRRNGNIVPAGPEDLDIGQKESAKASLPLPYRYKNDDDDAKSRKDNRVESVGDSPPKPVISPPNAKKNDSSSTRNAKHFIPIVKPPGVEDSQIRPEERPRGAHVMPSDTDEIQDIQNKVVGILSRDM